MDYRDITPEERSALQRFADREHTHCVHWKDRLNDTYWYNARIWSDGQPGDGPTLHGLRNMLGPTWLYDVCDVEPRPTR